MDEIVARTLAIESRVPVVRRRTELAMMRLSRSPFSSRFAFGAALAVAIALLVVPHRAWAQPGPASRYLKQRHDEVTRILRRAAETDEARRQRSAEVSQIIRSLLDYEEISRRALGEHWDSRTPEQRQQFVDLLRQLVERNYEANLERILEYELRYLEEDAVAEGAVVRTEARSRTERRQPPVEIAYSMRRDGNGWRVVDVTTDDVSMVQNYRTQFSRIIRENGWDELIRRMRQRLESTPRE
jgi:phospholipid transport system substrate-binding protein